MLPRLLVLSLAPPLDSSLVTLTVERCMLAVLLAQSCVAAWGTPRGVSVSACAGVRVASNTDCLSHRAYEAATRGRVGERAQAPRALCNSLSSVLVA